MDTVPLYRQAYRNAASEPEKKIAARIELHQRFALPPACFILALIGIPLGASYRKGGKSAAFVVTAGLAFLYWLGLISMTGLARQGKLPVGIAVWIPNALFAIAGLILILRLDRPGDWDLIGACRRFLGWIWESVRSTLPATSGGVRSRRVLRFGIMPQVIDGYVLAGFLFYFVLFLISFVLVFHVYTFFELLSDIVKNHIPMSRVLAYLFFLTPKLIYDSTPISVLVAVLVTFGILTKNNEVIAFKASGVSAYRLALPVLAICIVFSGGLFAFDHYYVPQANRKQDAIRNEIKGRPVQTYLRPDRKWIINEKAHRIYYYKYFDAAAKIMVGVNVYELDPGNFHLTRQIYAEKARWEWTLQKWVFENGWSRDFNRSRETLNFSGQATTFNELTEKPDYFLKEVLQEKQMNFEQLAAYIRELQQSGFDTIALQVQFYKKFAVPLFAIIMALISIPFSFVVGNRGAMAGVGVSLVIAIAYIGLNMLSEQLGDVNLLPAAVAAWSPNLVFTLTGLYFFSRMRT